jgi:hypothetical protein
MNLKKLSTFGLLLFVTLFAKSQVSLPEWRDSSLIPISRMVQHSEFLNNIYSFPSKPRNKWEFGLKVGSPSIMGDVSANYPALGFGVHVRKSLGYLLSIRAEYFHGTPSGLDWNASKNYNYNSAWTNNGYLANIRSGNNFSAAQDKVFYNYKSSVNDISLQGIVNLNNIRFHKAQNKFNIYSIMGIGLTFFETKIDAIKGTNQKYSFNSIPDGTWDNKNQVRDQVKSLLDGTYETLAERDPLKGSKLFGMSSTFSISGGLGFAFKLSPKVNIAVEDRIVLTKSDLLDGQRWAATPLGDAALTPDNDHYNFLSIGLNINLF